MPYTHNPFHTNQKVVCINETFPMVVTTMQDKSNIGKQAITHPKKGEVLTIDEILGEYLRFDNYDIDDETHPEYGFRWWKHTHFKPFENSLESIEHLQIDEIHLPKHSLSEIIFFANIKATKAEWMELFGDKQSNF